MDSGRIIYSIINTINGKMYIGQTSEGLGRRKKRHIYNANNGTKHILYRAIRKHGIDCFDFNTIYTCNENDNINLKEIEFIKFFNTKIPNGYNMTDGGEGISGLTRTPEHNAKIGMANKGRKISDEQKQLLRTINIGKKLSEEHIRKIKESHSTPEYKEKVRADHLGKKLTEEHKEKLRKANLGKTQKGRKKSLEERQKISQAMRGRKLTDEWKKNIGKGNKGKIRKPISDETRKKLSVAHMGNTNAKRKIKKEDLI